MFPAAARSITLVFLIAACTPVFGATVSWTNGLGGDWHTASNWDTGTVPGATDDVVVNLPGTYTITVTTADVTINSLTLGSSDGVSTQ
ncbi:MAG: hypothetical protein KY432_06790, partial [Acidobacteria bacterium]|nr:hypothetical protein [Acidobacteriota bacterium]